MLSSRLKNRVVVVVVSFLATTSMLMAQPGTVLSYQKISDTEGGFTGDLDNCDDFGYSVAPMGDLDGDGINDLAVGAVLDERGAVWVLFLNSDGTVKSHQKISDTEGGFTGVLDHSGFFGHSVSALGDLNGDGVADLAVGAPRDFDGGAQHGSVWVLFLNSDGTVKSHQKISDTEGGFTGTLNDGDWFGTALASPGDLDGDGVADVIVGAPKHGDGGPRRGAVWILFLNSDGTVKSHQKISDTEGGFTGELDDYYWFGYSAASLGDLDGDGVGDVAVGAPGPGSGGTRPGAVWVLFLNSDGTVKSHRKISDTEGGFTGELTGNDWFGVSAASLGDLDGDGTGDLAVGAFLDDDGGSNRGAVWVLFLDGVTACPWDLNGDGVVSGHDLFELITDFGSCDGSPADFDGDGCVTVSDLLALIFNFGPCPDGGCPWDVNGDGTVDRSDLWQVLRNLGPCDGCPEDVDGDGVVDFEDVIAVATHFGSCP